MQFKLNSQINNQPLARVTDSTPLITPLHCVVYFAARANGFNFLQNAKYTTRTTNGSTKRQCTS
jgi:hypothetical protein